MSGQLHSAAISEDDLTRQCLGLIAVLERLAAGIAPRQEPCELIDLDYERLVEQPYQARKAAMRKASERARRSAA